MSGGGGGGGGFSAPPAGPCQNLVVETAIQSPDPRIVPHLTQGQVLDVRLEAQGTAPTVFLYYNDQRAGTLVFTGLPRLIQCLQDGYDFAATVMRVSGPDCQVRVHPA